MQAKSPGLHSLRIRHDEWQQAERIGEVMSGPKLKTSQVLRWALTEGLVKVARDLRDLKTLRRAG